jgi:hypothetical protein
LVCSAPALGDTMPSSVTVDEPTANTPMRSELADRGTA